MRAGRILRRLVMDRIIAEVPSLGGRVYDRAVDGTAYPYVTLGPSDFSDQSPTCMTLRPYGLQVDVWGQDTNKGALEDVVDDVVASLVGWSPAPDLAAHPFSLELVRIMDDPDGRSVHGVVQVSALVEISSF